MDRSTPTDTPRWIPTVQCSTACGGHCSRTCLQCSPGMWHISVGPACVSQQPRVVQTSIAEGVSNALRCGPEHTHTHPHTRQSLFYVPMRVMAFA